MQDIADRLGISKVSVCKAINGQPGVSDQLKQSIIDVAEEIGYRKTIFNGVRLTGTFAFFIPKRFFFKNESFYTEIYYHLNIICQSAGAELSVFVIDDKDESRCELPATLSSAKKYTGAFLAGQMENDYFDLLRGLDLPIIAIDAYFPNRSGDFIVSDNYRVGYHAAAYLYEKGHRKIGFVGYNKDTRDNNVDRYMGFQALLLRKGLDVRSDWMLSEDSNYINQYTVDFTLPPDLPTAFICHCDATAFFLTQRLQGMGLRVPEDISVIGIDNTEISSVSSPKITTIDINRGMFAQAAFDAMLNRLKNPDIPSITHYIQNKIIERESVIQI